MDESATTAIAANNDNLPALSNKRILAQHADCSFSFALSSCSPIFSLIAWLIPLAHAYAKRIGALSLKREEAASSSSSSSARNGARDAIGLQVERPLREEEKALLLASYEVCFPLPLLFLSILLLFLLLSLGVQAPGRPQGREG